MSRGAVLPVALAVASATTGMVTAAPKRAPTVTDSEPRVDGALSAAVVRAALKRRHAALLACYRKGLAKNAELEGDELISFTIGKEGKVTAIQAAGLGAPVDECVASAIRGIAFGRPRDGKPVEVVHSLSFASGQTRALAGLGPTPPAAGGASVGVGTSGRLGDGGLGSGFSGPPGSGQRRPAAPSVKVGTPTVTGQLDASLIRRMVRGNLNRLTYCYEKELAANATLAGKLRLDFTIDAAGAVTRASASGLGNANVEACMTRVIQSITFPRPKSGEVTVGYPLTMSPGQ